MNQLYLFRALWLLVLTLVAQAAYSFKVVGYMPSWAGSASSIQYSKLTHINYSFLLPNSDGSFRPIENPSKLQSIVSSAHAAGVKVYIAIGGWDIGAGPGNDGPFETLAANATSRNNFVNNCVNFVNQYNLDGVDIDWEYPDPGASANNYAALMQALSNAMHSRGKGLSAAVVANGYTGGGVLSSVFAMIDHLNIMSYDANNFDHSTYDYAVQSLNYWKGRGLPASKAIVGVPFYGRPSWESFATLVARGANPYADVFGNVGYNGITTIKNKTNLAVDQAGGIMMWELSQDATGANSLLSAIDQVVVARGVKGGGGGGGGGGGTQSPYGGSARNIPGKIEAEHYDNGGAGVAYNDLTSNNEGGQFRTDAVDIEATTDAGAGHNVGWVAAGEWLEYTVNVTTAGTYTMQFRVAATAAGKFFHVEVGGANVTGTISVPNTGGWQTWTTVTKTGVSLTAGQKVMRIVMDTDGFNLNYVNVTTGGGGGGNTPPSVNLTSPAGGQQFSAGANVSIAANASDANGSVTKVEFFVDGNKISEDLSSPYTATYSNAIAGTHSITARATDNAGATTTSAAVSISVTSGGGGGGSCAGVPQYVENGGYVAGSKVQNQGKQYQCKPWPYSGWCNGASWAYGPGTGAYWQDAWTLVGNCTAKAAATESVDMNIIEVYPNPTPDYSVIKINAEDVMNAHISVVNSMGAEVYSTDLNGQDGTVNLEGMESGIYMIKVTSGENVWFKKLVKQ